MKIYTRDNCAACDQTKRMLNSAGVTYTELNIEHNADALAMLFALGFKQVPVIDTGTEQWSGFNAIKLKEYIDNQNHSKT